MQTISRKLSLIALISLCPALSWAAAEPTVNLEGLEYSIMASTPAPDGFLKSRITRIERGDYTELYCYRAPDGQNLFCENNERPETCSFFTLIDGNWFKQHGLWCVSEGKDGTLAISRIG